LPYAPRARCGERASADVSHLGARMGHSPRSAPSFSDRLTIAMLDLSVGMDGESAFRSLVDGVRA